MRALVLLSTLAACGCDALVGIDAWSPGEAAPDAAATAAGGHGSADAGSGGGGASPCGRDCLGAPCPSQGCAAESVETGQAIAAVATGAGFRCWLEQPAGSPTLWCSDGTLSVSQPLGSPAFALAIGSSGVAWAETLPTPTLSYSPLPFPGAPEAFADVPELRGVALAGERVFWIQPANLCFADVAGGGSCPQHPSAPIGVATTDTEVVWADATDAELAGPALRWVPATDPGAATKSLGLAAPPTAIAAGVQGVYLSGSDAASILVVRLDTTQIAPLAATQPGAGPIAVASDAVYWITDPGTSSWSLPVECGSTGQTRIWRARETAKPPADAELLAEGEDCASRIAVDDAYVYWSTPTAVRRVPR